MKNCRKLTLVFLVVMFIFPALVQIGSVSKTTNIYYAKTYASSYVPHGQIWIQSNEEFSIQATAESWAGDGSEDHPYIITGYFFDCETQPLRIWHTTVHWKFIDNIVDGVGDDIQCGTWILDASNGAIIDCEFLNRHSGIVLDNAENISIRGNYVHDVRLNGLEIYGMMINCDITDNILENCLYSGILLLQGMTSGNISGNVISNCGGRGISIQSGFYNSEVKFNTINEMGSNGIYIGIAVGSEIEFNTIANVSDVGIEVLGFNSCNLKNNTIEDVTGIGMSVDYCRHSNLSLNQIQTCSDIGIESSGGENTTVIGTTITGCGEYAIWLNDETESFEIKYNVFINNGGDCQLFDDGNTNYFGYNYFSDWQSPDANGDSYVDISYQIDGGSENSDGFPITIIGYYPIYEEITTTTSSTSETIPTTSGTNTTTSTSIALEIPMQLILVGGAVGAIVIVVGITILKRR